jgi:hypothetical protein
VSLRLRDRSGTEGASLPHRKRSERLDITAGVPETAVTAALEPVGRKGPTLLPRDVAHDIVGVLRVNLHSARASDLEAVARDVGPSAVELDEATWRPLLRVRFVDELSTDALRLLDGGTVGYTEDGLYALAGRNRSPIAFMTQEASWGAGAIVCKRGVRRVPFLSGAIDLAALAAGWVPLHASAWTTPAGIGVLASGFAHSGKTGALLAACQKGALPVGDDRILLSGDGCMVLGLGRPVEAKDWHIAQLGLARGARRWLARSTSTLAPRGAGRGTSTWSRLLDGARERARSLSSTEVDLSDFGAVGHPRARPHLLLLMETHDADGIEAERADPGSVPQRLAAHVGAELAPVLRSQLAYQYVHAGTGWPDVDGAPRRALRILENAVGNLPTWIVRHPYPCSLERLHAVTTELAASVA